MVAALQPALLVASLVALALTMLTVVLASLAAARSRQQLLGVLRILGMSRRQLRAVVAWSWADSRHRAGRRRGRADSLLSRVVTQVLDLRPFVGGRTQPHPEVETLVVLGRDGRVRARRGRRRSRRRRRRATGGTRRHRQDGRTMTAQIECADLVRIFKTEGVEVVALQGLTSWSTAAS